jgi:hypothetical protein
MVAIKFRTQAALSTQELEQMEVYTNCGELVKGPSRMADQLF